MLPNAMSNPSSSDKMIFIAFLWLVIAGSVGVLLRLAFVLDLPLWIDYKNLLHTHSHVAMMGWLFSALYLMIAKTFNLKGRFYFNLFWLFQLTIIGMLMFFPIQGYGLGSIPFTTAHMILSYLFAWKVIKDIRLMKLNGPNYPERFLITALVFMVVSTLGTWALGYMMAASLKGSAIYYASIQFFLHFQFNGWFIFAIIAIFLQYCKSHDLIINDRHLRIAYPTLLISCILTYALSVTWSTPKDFIFYLNSIGVIIQFAAMYYLYRWLMTNSGKWRPHFKGYLGNLLIFALLCLAVKIVIQTLVAIPALAVISYTIKNFVIGFIHLLMLGAITSFSLVFLINMGKVKIEKMKSGINIFLLGFVGSELILFLQGVMLWQKMGFLPYYYHILAILSALMPIGFLTLLIKMARKRVM
ncbi:MAG: hypothetical protein HKN68_03105 [Saprospiraceae bacterium]|nr:hypothetical protein [Saprospiraceae bacterium]